MRGRGPAGRRLAPPDGAAEPARGAPPLHGAGPSGGGGDSASRREREGRWCRPSRLRRSPVSYSINQNLSLGFPRGPHHLHQASAGLVEEKFERNFRVNREMRDEILVYESIL